MPHLGAETDLAVDAIGRRLAEVGLSAWLRTHAAAGLSVWAAWLVRLVAQRYGPERFVDDCATLAVAVWNDNEEVWPLVDRRVGKGIDRAVRKRLKAIIHPMGASD